MPITPTYPGVYIEELPSGVRTITGVSTSVAAFVGYFSSGPLDEAVKVFSFGEFERRFGGLRSDSEAAYVIQQFFLNGGTEAWVIRTAGSGARAAAIALENDAGGSAASVLLITAASQGVWGNQLRVEVDYDTGDPRLADATAPFNLKVSKIATVDGSTRVVASETFRNLSMVASSPRHVVAVVNDGSELVSAALVGTPTNRPAHSGTISAALPALGPLTGSQTMDVELPATTAAAALSVDLTNISTASALAAALQSALRAATLTPAADLTKATVVARGSASTELYLEARSGLDDPAEILTFSDGGGSLATTLGLDDARSNVQKYVLGASVAVAAQALPAAGAQVGNDGALPGASELIGNESGKTGLHALLDVDLFNILCIPDTTRLADASAAQVAAAATALCEAERAFYILDVPHADATRDQVDEIQQWLDDNATLRHRNAALYYPRPKIADPLNEFRLRLIAPSGTMAGLYARTDGSRGVWKAPAGTEAALRGVQQLEYKLTDAENGALNPLAINCLRTFPVFGSVAWGARTLDGADQKASEWKYVPVRRLALFLEESLFRGSKWVVFEPNDEPLWAQIRLNFGAFMHNLFRQGAFQGTKPSDAYFVKCDRETTTQNDIDRGIVNIVVGFAPLKPAEFVIIKLQQIAGQIEA